MYNLPVLEIIHLNADRNDLIDLFKNNGICMKCLNIQFNAGVYAIASEMRACGRVCLVLQAPTENLPLV